MSNREERAALRAATWTAEVVSPGTPKGKLYARLDYAERLAALIALNERAWLAIGGEVAVGSPRSQWPGEIFELDHRG